MGSRVVVEQCRRGPGSRREGGDFRRDSRDSRDFRRDGRGGDFRGQKSNRYGPPVQTRYRLAVENLSTRCSWQVCDNLFVTKS
jgi:hypothetical protein